MILREGRIAFKESAVQYEYLREPGIEADGHSDEKLVKVAKGLDVVVVRHVALVEAAEVAEQVDCHADVDKTDDAGPDEDGPRTTLDLLLLEP